MAAGDLASVGLGGAVWSVEFEIRGDAVTAVHHLMWCHPHHFAVVGEGRTVIMSEMAVDCLHEKFGTTGPMTVTPVGSE